jgi:hypothetical protein
MADDPLPVEWRYKQKDVLEVVPGDRHTAWTQLLLWAFDKTPKTATFRTGISGIDLENFDFRQPIALDERSDKIVSSSERVAELYSKISYPYQSPLTRAAYNNLVYAALAIVIIIVYIKWLFFNEGGTTGEAPYASSTDNEAWRDLAQQRFAY